MFCVGWVESSRPPLDKRVGLEDSTHPTPPSIRRTRRRNRFGRRRRALATPPHKSLRVLFVDDEKHLQDVMRSELPRLGHEVTVCADGHEAFKILEKSKFDAAILDLRMPGISGIEVLERLKEVSPDTE